MAAKRRKRPGAEFAPGASEVLDGRRNYLKGAVFWPRYMLLAARVPSMINEKKKGGRIKIKRKKSARKMLLASGLSMNPSIIFFIAILSSSG
ncbi:hypothetical protein [Candidatus Methylomicrobium oryzae]|uniref:hypothetical protein n=1 Tax=Candidatus Methylomicrobium oryzae TaxID=2802053 RepID=UPI0019245892|nr:hypothetical protein [Methylomicrobium sp. RS1]MBL1263292.1 hypothetical protein [Methylomicrobium sp. RS1]